MLASQPDMRYGRRGVLNHTHIKHERGYSISSLYLSVMHVFFLYLKSKTKRGVQPSFLLASLKLHHPAAKAKYVLVYGEAC